MAEQPFEPNANAAQTQDLGYETRDASGRVAWCAVGGILVLLFAALLAVAMLTRWLAPQKQLVPSQAFDGLPTGGETRLRETRKQQQAAQMEALGGYAWIDRQSGVASIPIDRAIEMIVANPALLQGSPVEAEVKPGELSEDAK